MRRHDWRETLGRCAGAVAWVFVSGTWGFAETVPGPAGFEQTVRPFFESYCLDCHDDASKKGNLSLERIDPDFLGGEDFETWRVVREQLSFHEMPPEKKGQPSMAERGAVLAWIRGELLETQRPGVQTHEKLQLPEYGNYVDHEFLFGERLPFVRPAPPRVWRLRPGIYDTIVPRLGERISGHANGLSERDGAGIKDYAADAFIDEASTAPLLGNAKKAAASLVAPHSKDGPLKRLVSEDGPPSQEEVASAIETTFRKALHRNPTGEELDRFAAFHETAKQTGGHKSAGPALVTAVLMQPEALYRQERGDGAMDAHGRARLAPREITHALSFALDNQPVGEFLDAARNGELASREQIRRLLRDRLRHESHDHSRNPRLVQFFREYFGYPNALEVFKDQPEGGAHEPERLVADLEMTIVDILKKDRQVLAELLTTRKYYVNTSYDHYGRYQRLEAGQPVDASAQISRTIVPQLHRRFSGPAGMMDFLAKSEHVEQVFVRHVFRYFMGRNETLGDANTLQDAHQTYRQSNGSFNELVVSLLRTRKTITCRKSRRSFGQHRGGIGEYSRPLRADSNKGAAQKNQRVAVGYSFAGPKLRLISATTSHPLTTRHSATPQLLRAC